MTNVTPVNHHQNIPTVAKSFIAASGEIGNADLAPKLRHLVDLRASQMNQCAFCVKMHTEEALADGESQERLQRLVVWRHVDDFTPAEKAAFAWTEALTDLNPDTDYGRLRADLRNHFEDAQISAITAAIAMINLWNRVQVSNH
ncbi:carboxymuconolactone decarboxylase family protein [Roseibium porphyridii]|uniref:Carboxymuconolactone decarboxylase family protein n=1 Tax=Roseibium porphyridii TaxID=2866279 RepID=A0ABY8F3I3_9HYPH|nr:MULTISPECIES: carboxymuconolactone decarboxylase family protein [Stappiaceae]QFT29058.1 Carboxymuconolactone decarboxylase family protein [Labrenzia sp. THAF82]WFE90058.1 carboxymuconolactone decarboxylase family protein [Roseibium sp. KMA01]